MSKYPKERKPASAPRTGRPPTMGKPVKMSIYLTDTQSKWAKSHGLSVAEYIRQLIDNEIASLPFEFINDNPDEPIIID